MSVDLPAFETTHVHTDDCQWFECRLTRERDQALKQLAAVTATRERFRKRFREDERQILKARKLLRTAMKQNPAGPGSDATHEAFAALDWRKAR